MTPERHAHLSRSLIALVGGVEAAATLTRASKSQLSNYQNANHPSVMPADVMADLERHAGVPIYSGAILDNVQVSPAADLVRAVSDLDFAASDLAHVSIMSLRAESDGGEVLTAAERRHISMKASEARRMLAQVAATLAAADERDGHTGQRTREEPSSNPHQTGPASPRVAAPVRVAPALSRPFRLRPQSSCFSGVPRSHHRAGAGSSQLEN